MAFMWFTEEEILNEKWMPVTDYNGSFNKSHLVSDLGRVMTLFRKGMKRQRLLKQYVDGHGYPRVKLSANGYSRSQRVHRLVGLVFVNNPRPDYYTQINHKKGIKIDNRAWELEWCDNDENIDHATKMGLMIKGRVPANARPVSQYSLDRNKVNTFRSIDEAGRSLGICSISIGNAIRNSGVSGGFIWAYDGVVPDFDYIFSPMISTKMKPFTVFKMIKDGKNFHKGEQVVNGLNIRHICREMGLSNTDTLNATACLAGSRRSVRGYIFEYD